VTDWTWPNTRVAYVQDGDTQAFTFVHTGTSTVDHGFGIRSDVTDTTSIVQSVRLNRINADPSSTPTGAKAKARVVELLTGVPVTVVTLGKYKYAGPEVQDLPERMAEVTLPDGSNLSDLLVSEQLAVYWNGQGPRPDGGAA